MVKPTKPHDTAAAIPVSTPERKSIETSVAVARMPLAAVAAHKEIKMLIAEFENKEYGIKTQVHQLTDRYSVSLIDTDAEKTLEAVLLYRELDRAIAKAKEIANV